MPNIFMILFILFIFLLFFSNSQKRKMQELQQVKNKSLEVGATVATYSGIVGVVVSLDEKYVELSSSNSTFILVRESVSKVIDEEILLLNSKTTVNEDLSNISLEVMVPNKKSKRDEYGF